MNKLYDASKKKSSSQNGRQDQVRALISRVLNYTYYFFSKQFVCVLNTLKLENYDLKPMGIHNFPIIHF
jgi:hypothetical protein